MKKEQVNGSWTYIYYIALVTDFIENTFATSSAVFCNLNYCNKTRIYETYDNNLTSSLH